MVATYRVTPRIMNMGIGLGFVVGGTQALYWLVASAQGGLWGTLFGVLVGAGFIFAAFDYLYRRPYEVRVADSGVVEFVRFLRTTQVQIQAIQQLQKKGSEPNGGNEDVDTREVRIGHDHGCETVPYFREIDALVADLIARNPSIVVEGEWQKEGSNTVVAVVALIAVLVGGLFFLSWMFSAPGTFPQVDRLLGTGHK